MYGHVFELDYNLKWLKKTQTIYIDVFISKKLIVPDEPSVKAGWDHEYICIIMDKVQVALK